MAAMIAAARWVPASICSASAPAGQWGQGNWFF